MPSNERMSGNDQQDRPKVELNGVTQLLHKSQWLQHFM